MQYRFAARNQCLRKIGKSMSPPANMSDEPKNPPGGSLMINVGVDQWDYAPVRLETLLDLIEEVRK